MSFTYDESLSSARDHVRFALGDIDAAHPLLSDETILAKLTACGFGEAVAQLAEGLASQYAQLPDTFTDDEGLKLTWAERVAQWRAVAVSARAGGRALSSGQTCVQAENASGVMAGFRSC